MTRPLLLRVLIWGTVTGVIGAVCWGKSSYETGWLPLLKGGGLGGGDRCGRSAVHCQAPWQTKRKELLEEKLRTQGVGLLHQPANP
jgi:hypothetical protein